MCIRQRKMATLRYVLGLLLAIHPVLSLPEPGVWTTTYDNNNDVHAFAKSVFKDTVITVSINCTNKVEVDLYLEWSLRFSPCAEEYDGVEGDRGHKLSYLMRPDAVHIDSFKYDTLEYERNATVISCKDGVHIPLPDYSDMKHQIVKAFTVKNMTDSKKADGGSSKADATKAPQLAQVTVKPPSRRKREDAAASDKKTPVPVKTKQSTTVNPKASFSHDKSDEIHFAKFWNDGYFIFVLRLTPKEAKKNFSAQVTVRMPGPHGFISAVEYPLEIFYGIMGLVYLGYGIVWLVLLGCNWRDLLRVQFWIEGVIVLGMLEKAVFFAEYESIAKSGESVRGAVIVAELVSAMKRALARMLVIVVSLGFGIVKPRLGQTFHKVLCAGVLYFVLGSIEGCMRALKSKSDQSNELMLAAVPLAVLDAVICWWIFSSLVQTIRTLRLRRNIVKLSLYRHFTNTLIFSVLASIAYMIWSIVQHRIKTCITDWRELWVDDAFWHLLFSVLLLIIMILWRPTANNQRYAFSPLLDAAEDEIDDDTVMNDAFDGMKMRTKLTNGSPKQKDRQKSVEEDLKWIEENIPSSVSDKALPSLLDSDEELQNTHFEISKMQ